jgi:hypothetical protein
LRVFSGFSSFSSLLSHPSIHLFIYLFICLNCTCSYVKTILSVEYIIFMVTLDREGCPKLVKKYKILGLQSFLRERHNKRHASHDGWYKMSVYKQTMNELKWEFCYLFFNVQYI